MTISMLIQQLASDDVQQRRRAAEALAQQPDIAPATLVLTQACGDHDEQVQEWAVAALENLGTPPVDYAADLAGLLNHPAGLVGYWAATLLGRMGEDAASAKEALASTLSGTAEIAVRQRAAWALGKMGPAAADAAHVLRQASQSSDARLRRLAMQALTQIGHG
jgi:HEAT repeat protein